MRSPQSDSTHVDGVNGEQRPVSAAGRAPWISLAIADWLVVALAAPYIALNTVFPGPALTYSLGIGLAMASVGILLLAGIAPRELFLRFAWPSRQGALLMTLLLIFIPGALLAGRAQPLGALNDLIYAPASAIAQELYFRSALLCALTHLLAGKRVDAPRVAIVLQAALFAVWHIRAFEVTTILPAFAILALTFVAGIIWGEEVRRDRTLVWCALEHTWFLIVQ